MNDLGNIGDLIGATLDGKPPPYNAADIDLGDVRRLAGGALAALANATATVTAASLGSDAAGGGTGDDDLSDDVFDDLDDILFVQARIACLVDRHIVRRNRRVARALLCVVGRIPPVVVTVGVTEGSCHAFVTQETPPQNLSFLRRGRNDSLVACWIRGGACWVR